MRGKARSSGTYPLLTNVGRLEVVPLIGREATMSGYPKRLTRRHFLLAGAAAAGGAVLSACAATPTPQVIEKEVTKVVKEIVKETVIVPTQQIIEKEVVVTATPSAEEMSDTQRIVLQGPQGEGNFDPMTMGHWFSNAGIKPALWCTLVGMDENMNLYPWGAEKWSWDEENLTWTFYIRKGMKFSDGSPITAKDFAYSIKRSIKDLDPDYHVQEQEAGRAGPLVSFAHMMCNDIDGVRDLRDGTITAEQWEDQYGDAVSAVDDFTLAIRCAYVVPENLFMGKMAYNGSQCVKQENVEAGTPDQVWYENPVTSGPFMLESHVIDQYWTLVRNPHYGGGEPAILTEAKHMILPDAQTRLIAYENKELDAIFLAEADALEYVKEDHPRHAELMSTPLAVIVYVWMFNLPPIDDLHVRRALIRAIDREKTVEAVFRGTAKFSPTYIPDYTPGWELPANYDEVYMTYDPAAAADEFKQSEYYDDIMSGALPIRLSFTAGMEQTSGGRMWEAFVDQWKTNLGIDVKLQQTEFELEGQMSSRYNLASNGRGLLYADTDAWVGNVMDMYDPTGSWGRLKVGPEGKLTDILTLPRMSEEDDARFTETWKVGGAIIDKAERLKLYQEWEYLREKWAIEVPLYYPLTFAARQPWVKDLRLTPQNGLHIDRAWIARH